MGAEWVPLAAVLAYCGMIACETVCVRFRLLRCPLVGARVARCLRLGLGVAALSIVCPRLGSGPFLGDCLSLFGCVRQ